MNAELAVYHILANDVTFNAHVGGSASASKIYYDIAPQTAVLPYTVLRESSVDPNDTKSGGSDFDFDNIEVRHFAATRLEVANMARDARLALDRVAEGTYNTIQVVSIQYITQFSDVEEMEDSVQHIKEQLYKVIAR
jgi:hypothetical protein